MNDIRTLRAGTLITHEIEIKRSRFIATLARADTEDEARALIDMVRSEHPQARHNCSAYLISADGRNAIQHSSDDGELSGTAGTPMLEALKMSDTWNVTAVVTRYFGGVLLGAGGLIRAYSSAVSEALARAPHVVIKTLNIARITVDPNDAGKFQSELHSANVPIVGSTWDARVHLDIAATDDDIEQWGDRAMVLTHGQASVHVTGRTRIEVDA